MLGPWPLLLSLAAAVVDESGRYHAGTDLSMLAPPEITEEDRNASIDLSKQPPEKLFRLLAYELFREEQRAPETRFGIRDFQYLTELGCKERLLQLVVDTRNISEVVRVYHQNVTGTAGLYWLLHKFPDEHSWVWLLAVSHQRVLRKVNHHFTRLVGMALDDPAGCFSPNFRPILMTAVATWKKIHGDYIALLWNAVAFGVLGDVTAWREVDEETNVAEEGPGGPPPNVSWSENIIFGNMWVASAQKWLEHHAGELEEAVVVELRDLEGGLAQQRAAAYSRWHRSHDGVLSSFEYLRRQTFGGWPLDKGLLRGLLRHVWRPGYGEQPRVSVGDFGAGGGRYSEWLNETGLVQAFAFDGVLSVADISGGAVQEVDLAGYVELWRTFEWALCLEVGQHVPRTKTPTLLRNLRRHAERGLVISWAPPAAGAAGETASTAHGAIEEAELVDLVERETGFLFDRPITATLRAGCELDELAKSVAIFRKPQ